MRKIVRYINPLARLGTRQYSLIFPLVTNILVTILSEVYCYAIAHNPEAVGTYIIFVNVGLLVYFSFRDGFKGGVISTLVTLSYYLYIIYSREYSGERLITSIDTTALLGVLYFLIAAIIGFLKQQIDVLIIREIEARQIAEEGKLRLQTILQQLPVGVMIVEAKGKVLEGNKQLEQILGRKISGTLNRDPKYLSPYALRNNKQLTPDEWPITRALIKGEVIRNEEIEYLKQNNQKISLKVSASPIKNRSNNIVAAVSILNDYTREKETEKRKDDFINMASHELKTPLTSMKIFIEILNRNFNKKQDPQSAKIIQNIKNQTERLQELVNNLLDVSRIQTGKLNFNKEQFFLDQLISESVEVLQTTTESHRIQFKNTQRFKVNADRFRIYQVLTNLITNAIKYSPDNTDIIIRIKKENSKVLVSVADSGIGIAKSEQKKIFERLYQVTDSTEKTFPGLGMGLYISYQIIQRHKGRIWVEGEKGKGSTFYFDLPLSK